MCIRDSRISVLCVICDMPGTYYAPYPLVEKSLKHVWKTSFLYFCIFRADANYYDGKRNRNRIFQHFRRLFLPGALKKCPLLSHWAIGQSCFDFVHHYYCSWPELVLYRILNRDSVVQLVFIAADQTRKRTKMSWGKKAGKHIVFNNMLRSFPKTGMLISYPRLP